MLVLRRRIHCVATMVTMSVIGVVWGMIFAENAFSQIETNGGRFSLLDELTRNVNVSAAKNTLVALRCKALFIIVLDL